MIILNIFKAKDLGEHLVKGLTIHATVPFPEIAGTDWSNRSLRLFVEQGRDLAQALYSILPGGTVDQLLGALLNLKASQFTVPFDAPKPAPESGAAMATITLERLQTIVNEYCSCGGKGPHDQDVCPVCRVWHHVYQTVIR